MKNCYSSLINLVLIFLIIDTEHVGMLKWHKKMKNGYGWLKVGSGCGYSLAVIWTQQQNAEVGKFEKWKALTGLLYICTLVSSNWHDLLLQTDTDWQTNYVALSQAREVRLHFNVFIFKLIYLIESANQTCWHNETTMKFDE